MRFPPSFLDEIRARLAVSQVVSRRVALKRQGREYIGLSPFKTERTPSFTVNDTKGFYHCFASGEHGDIFTFVMRTEGLSFPEAVERLAAEAGVPMPKQSSEAERAQGERLRLGEVLETSCRWLEEQLWGPRGRQARDYLQRRAVPEELARRFRMGFAPDDRSALKEHLAAKGFTPEEMALSGMQVAGPDIPVSYDRFRNRLIIPITDPRERVIAFGGRALGAEQKPKYLNSPETPLFHKGSVLFNLAKARGPAHDRGRVVVVEGYMDAIALAGAGIGEVVAPLGTALTDRQLALLWRLASEPILCFDGDAAGQKAAHRAIETALPLLKPGQSLRFAFLPDGLDPDDLVRQEGAAAVEVVLSAARPLVEVLFERELAAGDHGTPERRAHLEHRLRTLIGSIADAGVRHHYGEAIRDRLRTLWGARPGAEPQRRGNSTQAGAAWRRPESAGRGGDRRPGGPRSDHQAARRPITGEASPSLKMSQLVRAGLAPAAGREALILRTLLNHPWLIDEFAEEIAELRLTSKTLAGLRDAVLAVHAEHAPLDSARLATHLNRLGYADGLSLVARTITHRSDRFAEPEASPPEVETGWRDIIALQRKAELAEELRSAEQAFLAEASDAALARLGDARKRLEEAERRSAGRGET